MGKKSAAILLITTLLIGSVSPAAYAMDLSDILEKASETASEIRDAAGQAGETLSGFADQAGEMIPIWADNAGQTAARVRERIDEAGVKITITAAELGNASLEKASELTDTAGAAADDVIGAVTGAADFVIDQAGHVVDLAQAGADRLTSTADSAFRILQETGGALIQVAEDAVSGIDLNDPANWEKARLLIEESLNRAYAEGILSQNADRGTLQVVTDIVYKAFMYGYRYSEGQITLGEYVSALSEVLIREGLPVGVSFLVRMLPLGRIPHAERLAQNVTYYLIARAYEDKDPDEIEAEENLLLEISRDEQTAPSGAEEENTKEDDK